MVELFVFFLFCFLIIQFYRIQIIQGKRWQEMALQQHRYVIVEPFKRGSFFSNTSIKEGHPENEQPFVMDIPKFHLYVDPEAIPEKIKMEVAEKVATLSPKKREKIIASLYKSSRNRKLLSWLEPEEKDTLLAWWKGYYPKHKLPSNALYFAPDYKRSYPFGRLLGQVLHTVQEEKDLLHFQSIPTGGLELYCNDYLQGVLGKRLLLRSPNHFMEINQVLQAPRDGADVYLTINHYLQAIAEQELEKGVINAGAKGGWVVMIDPYTGEILALAQYPFFDVRHFSDYYNRPELWESTRTRAITDAFEPGSIFKPISIAIGLLACEELQSKNKPSFFTPTEPIFTAQGSFPNTRFALKDGRVHKFLNMYMAIQKSSNIFSGKIIQKVIEQMGEKWYREKLVDLFGFGKKTGIELPAESPGMVPTAGKLNPNKTLEWSTPTPYSMAIGHNILINSLQLVRVYSIFANGGYEVHPTLIRKIVKNKQQVLIDNTKRPLGKRLLSPSIVKELVKGMKYTTKIGGTSPRSNIPLYSEAGKSGTSEKIIDGKYSHERYIASFIGFAPASHPRFVMMVTLDEPAHIFIPGVGKNWHGGISPSPIFREIGKRALSYLGVEPDDPYSEDWVQEVTELKTLYDKWNR